MSTYLIYFSPTGGTQKVMEMLGETFGETDRIDLCNNWDFTRYSFDSEDLCLIGVPSYGGRVPEAALERLRQMAGNGAEAVIIAVYGNRDFDDTLIELKNEISGCNFRVISAVAAIAEHSIARRYAKGRPDEKDYKELKGFAEKIIAKRNKHTEIFKVPGNIPYREYKSSAFKYTVSDSCSNCGICAEKCPVRAIPSNNPKSVKADRCIGCMRCFYICPQKARIADKSIIDAITERLEPLCCDRKENKLFL